MENTRLVGLSLPFQDYLTLKVVSQSLSEVDDEFDYSIDFTLSMMLYRFRLKIEAMEITELEPYMRQYISLYQETIGESPQVTFFKVADHEFQVINAKCNRLSEWNKYSGCPYHYNLNIMVMAAIYDYRDDHFRTDAEALAKKLSFFTCASTPKKASDRIWVSAQLSDKDRDVLEFMKISINYFIKQRRMAVDDVLGYAIALWLEESIRKDPAKISEELGSCQSNLRCNKAFLGRLIHRSRKQKILVRKDIYHGLCYLQGQMKGGSHLTSFDSMIRASIIRFKNTYLFHGTAETLLSLNRHSFALYK